MEITFFGSSSRELENRHSVSFLVEDTYSNLLIDCGPGLMSGIFKANKKVSDINNILLTHVHGDHISSFAYFVWYRNIENFGNMSQNDLFVYGKKDVLELAKKTMHTISEDVGKIANKAGAKVLALVHIEPQIFGKENEMILEIRKKYNGIIMIPTEGTVYSI